MRHELLKFYEWNFLCGDHCEYTTLNDVVHNLTTKARADSTSFVNYFAFSQTKHVIDINFINLVCLSHFEFDGHSELTIIPFLKRVSRRAFTSITSVSEIDFSFSFEAVKRQICVNQIKCFNQQY